MAYTKSVSYTHLDVYKRQEHKKELSGYYRSERILKENLDPSGKIPEDNGNEKPLVYQKR